MRVALDTEQSPVNATVESVLPGVIDMHRLTDSSVKQVATQVSALSEDLIYLKRDMDNLTDILEDVGPDMQVAMRQAHTDSRRQLGRRTFLNIAGQLLGRQIAVAGEPAFDDDDASMEDRTEPECPVRHSVSRRRSVRHEESPHLELTTRSTTTVADTLPLNGSRLELRKKHKCLMDVYDEWNGTGDFHDEEGGIAGRNLKLKSSWRKHIPAKQYSRLKQTIDAIGNYAKQQGMDERDAVLALEPLFEESKCSPTNFLRGCFERGYLEKKKARGKSKENNSSS
jgi:hypothetical protein